MLLTSLPLMPSRRRPRGRCETQLRRDVVGYQTTFRSEVYPAKGIHDVQYTNLLITAFLLIRSPIGIVVDGPRLIYNGGGCHLDQGDTRDLLSGHR